VLDERIVQTTLQLGIDDLLQVPADSPDPAREPDIAIHASLRWFADPGVAGEATDPANLAFVPFAQDMALEVLRAHVAATNLLHGWLDLRAGAVSYWQKYKNDDKYVDYVSNANDVAYTYKYRSSYVSNETFLGAGFHWNNLFLDAYINPQIVTNGFNFISGMQQPLAWQVSLKYLMK
jgi:hypothetical protein